ncbi:MULTISPECIES: patatin-like phospholipase RssA [Aliagarivorans]|uniref:patatin-like phospholipase RssA n=1 Tax=Aliagarivorans TaxID=882379 RepID=UPI000429BD7A|nr:MULTISPECIES: patatin-like phospholipase RssA [Aliagarivorans]
MAERKPVIGLALGSGAARGWAHLGVIRELEEMGIRPSVIAGCSIGSLVGAAYAGGQLDTLEKWALGLSSWDVFNLMDFSLHKGGLVTGDKVFDAAEQQLGSSNIEDLPHRFACVATDLETGREIWLQQGKVRDAVRASCAMPGLMAPFQRNGQWLVDGAVVNPVPVALCRALGAELVIAVNLNSYHRSESLLRSENGGLVQPSTPDDPDNGFWRLLGGGKDFINSMLTKVNLNNDARSPGMVGVMSASIDIMQERLARARMAGDPPEVLLNPKLGEIGVMDFHRAEEAMAEGRRVAKVMRPAIFEELQLLS